MHSFWNFPHNGRSKRKQTVENKGSNAAPRLIITFLGMIFSTFTLSGNVIFIYYRSLVLVQPRKTRPCLTQRLLMGR